jgi:CarD family transcriptional regulator
VELAVGTVVVYPPHGVGRVASKETRTVQGVEQEVVVLALADGLSVTLPVQRARELLRPLVSEAELKRVQKTLREEGAPSDEIWSVRLKQLQEKLRRGDPLELAAIVRDGARHDQARTANPKAKSLPTGERALRVKARELLSGEIGFVRGLAPAEAEAWIDEQLAPLGS